MDQRTRERIMKLEPVLARYEGTGADSPEERAQWILQSAEREGITFEEALTSLEWDYGDGD